MDEKTIEAVRTLLAALGLNLAVRKQEDNIVHIDGKLPNGKEIFVTVNW